MSKSILVKVGQVACGCAERKENVAESVADVDEFVTHYLGTDPRSPTTGLPEALVEMQNEFERLLLLSGWSGTFRKDIQLVPATETVTRRVNLGTHDMPNQGRLHKHGTADYRTETRSAWKQAYVDVTHPTIDDIINDVVACVHNAATAAVLTAIFSDNTESGYAIFWPTFKLCMRLRIQERAEEISATLGYTNETGCYTYHC